MANSDSVRKLRTYQIIYRMNLSFANIVAICSRLHKSGILTPKRARLYKSFAQELQADINENLMNTMQNVEFRDQARFGKIRQQWEKETSDPDDVFLQAEERQKQLSSKQSTQRTAHKRIRK